MTEYLCSPVTTFWVLFEGIWLFCVYPAVTRYAWNEVLVDVFPHVNRVTYVQAYTFVAVIACAYGFGGIGAWQRWKESTAFYHDELCAVLKSTSADVRNAIREPRCPV